MADENSRDPVELREFVDVAVYPSVVCCTDL